MGNIICLTLLNRVIFPIFAHFRPYYSHCCYKKPDPDACRSAKTPFLNQQALQPQRRAPPTAQVRVPQDRRPFSPPCPLAPITTRHHSIVPFFSPQTADSSAWWKEAVPAPGEWRSLTRAPGAPSVMTAGTWTMPTWCAGSWAVEKPSMPRGLLTLGQDQDPSGWAT